MVLLSLVFQRNLLIGKPNGIRVDLDERERHMDLDDVSRAKAELPNFARSHAEVNGQLIRQIFLMDEVDRFVRCPHQ
ncbi:hypothetical protein ACU8M5_08900 [Rhizobium leguminosarum]